MLIQTTVAKNKQDTSTCICTFVDRDRQASLPVPSQNGASMEYGLTGESFKTFNNK